MTDVEPGVICGSLYDGVATTVDSVFEGEVITMETNVLGCVTFRIEGVSITVFMLEEAEMRNILADDVLLI